MGCCEVKRPPKYGNFQPQYPPQNNQGIFNQNNMLNLKQQVKDEGNYKNNKYKPRINNGIENNDDFPDNQKLNDPMSLGSSFEIDNKGSYNEINAKNSYISPYGGMNSTNYNCVKTIEEAHNEKNSLFD